MHIKEVISETPLEVIKEIDNEENITLEDAEKISPKESLLGYYLNGLLKKLNIEFIQIFTSNAISCAEYFAVKELPKSFITGKTFSL